MYAEYWNHIVSEYTTNQYAQESTIQALWENYFSEIFNYKKIYKEIDSQRIITIGVGQRAIPDIILRRNDLDIVDVELKKYSLSFSDDMEKQLISYMNQLHISVGLLICQKIYIYVYDYAGNKIKKLEISFKKNDPDGIKFIELFQKGNFSKDAIEEFIDSKQDFWKNVERIKFDIHEELVLKLLSEYFKKEYINSEVETALGDIKIGITVSSGGDSDISKIPEVPDNPDPDDGSGGKDYKKYFFEGTWYTKSRLVLAVVKAYIRDNPTVTYHELEDRFPKKIQGSYGVFLTSAQARSRTKELKKRFFVDDPIILKDGIAILVCSQWGAGSIGNIEKFVRQAEFLGYKIEGIK